MRILQASGYRRATGVDISAEQVELARQRGVGGVEQGDLMEYLASRADCYDAVLAVDVFEHFDKQQVLEVLDAIRSALAPDGVLIARVPNGESPYSGRLRYGDFTHGVAFTHHSLRQVALACGFSEVAVFPTNPAVHGPVSFCRLCLWKLVAAKRKASLAIETGLMGGHIVTQNLVAVARPGARASSH